MITPDQAGSAFLILTAVLAAIGGWWKWIRPRARGFMAKLTNALDTIGGRDAVTDSITGREISPALPGIGVRMAHQEEQTDLLITTVAKLVDQQNHTADLERRLTSVEVRQSVLEGDVELLQRGTVERVVARAESASAWSAMEAAIKSQPDPDPDGMDQN